MNRVVVAEPVWVRALWWVGFPLLGGGAGWLVNTGAEWYSSLGWGLMRGPVRAVASVPEPWGVVGLTILGGVAGVALALSAEDDSLTVEIGSDAVTLRMGGALRSRVERGAVAAVFLDGKQLVLLSRAGEELAREPCDLAARRVREGFTGQGYAWRDAGDPYREEYRRWVPDLPELPVGAEALFKAREKALERGDKGDLRDLRGELARLGFVVRDEQKHQYWRRLPT